MQKEIVRRVMEVIQKEGVREIFEDWIIHWFGLELKPEGIPRYDDFIKSVKKGEQVSLSDYVDMLIGFDFRSGIKGIESLRKLEDEPILLLANHHKGPIGGGWKNVLINYYVKQATGKEIRWLHGFDPTARQDLFREKLHNSINSIPVRDPGPQRAAKLFIQVIREKDSMGLYPEGDGSKNLRKALPEAGRLIAFCVRNGMHIVSCATRYQNNTFFLTFDTLDSKDIETSGEEGSDRYAKRQNTADYAMRNIAKHLPVNRRGYYK